MKVLSKLISSREQNMSLYIIVMFSLKLGHKDLHCVISNSHFSGSSLLYGTSATVEPLRSIWPCCLPSSSRVKYRRDVPEARVSREKRRYYGTYKLANWAKSQTLSWVWLSTNDWVRLQNKRGESDLPHRVLFYVIKVKGRVLVVWRKISPVWRKISPGCLICANSPSLLSDWK